jgi:hypothetical protein
MPENYILLERTELNASAASVTFANIPQTGYTDLKIVMSVRDTYAAASAALFVGFNGGTASLSSKYIQGSGSSVVSGNLPSNGLIGLNTGSTATANTFSNIEFYIPNYTSSTFKSYSADSVTENNATEAYTNLVAGLWSNTAAITSMTFTCGTAFTAGSTFSLYGIAALGTTPVIAPKAIGGNRIDNDGTYWYHTFTSSGTFTPQVGLTCDVLTIAGGGAGGGFNNGGGGGAGGLLYSASTSLASNSFTVTIGAGGAGTNTKPPVNGNNSSVIGGVTSLTATAGGGGGAGDGVGSQADGQNGGSGGGMSYSGTNFGTGTSGQGNNGGSKFGSPAFAGGGGGGAGAVGGNATSSAGGSGGAGTNTYSSWLSVVGLGVSGYVAGGGGGGSNANPGPAGAPGGAGGGGTGANPGAATAGTVNTGSGGGGSQSGFTTAGSGGSGLVIIRYPIA